MIYDGLIVGGRTARDIPTDCMLSHFTCLFWIYWSLKKNPLSVAEHYLYIERDHHGKSSIKEHQCYKSLQQKGPAYCCGYVDSVPDTGVWYQAKLICEGINGPCHCDKLSFLKRSRISTWLCKSCPWIAFLDICDLRYGLDHHFFLDWFMDWFFPQWAFITWRCQMHYILRLSIHPSICPYPTDPIYKKVKFYEKFEPEAISHFKV